MSGPLLLIAIFVLWKYREHVKKAAAVVGEAMKSAPSSGNSSDKDEKERSRRKLWTIVLILVGVIIFFWKIYTPGLQPSQVGSWSWSHWFWLLAFCGILITLIRIHAKSLGTLAGVLQTTVIVAILVMLLGFPVWFGVKDLFLPQVICRDASALEIRSCILNEKWTNWIKPAEGVADDGMNLCYSPGELISFEFKIEDGTSFYRFRAKEGKVVMTYVFKKLAPGEHSPLP